MMREDTYKRYVEGKGGWYCTSTLTYIFIWNYAFVADELLEETLGLEAAPVEVMVTSRVLVVISVSDYTTYINAHVSTFSMLQTNVDERANFF